VSRKSTHIILIIIKSDGAASRAIDLVVLVVVGFFYQTIVMARNKVIKRCHVWWKQDKAMR